MVRSDLGKKKILVADINNDQAMKSILSFDTICVIFFIDSPMHMHEKLIAEQEKSSSQ